MDITRRVLTRAADGMPPLVDNPLPPMTFTFAADLPPVSYNYEFAASEYPPEAPAYDTSVYSPQDTAMLDLPRASHAKKRDASYIPRPPNAFILFRSSFIKGGHIPGEIEGNHSALSKIIGRFSHVHSHRADTACLTRFLSPGKCWRALPREERKVWETKAIVALAEHRKKYPDWRFKPAANALAKVKDGPRKRGNRKGRGQSEKEERSREKRCAKIADLLVAGKTGSDLAAAVEQYDCETGRGRRLKDEGPMEGVDLPKIQCGGDVRDIPTAEADVKVPPAVNPNVPSTPTLNIATDGLDVKPLGTRSAVDGRFKVPLTAMFKRSSSAPAPRARSPATRARAPSSHRRDSFSAAPPPFARAASLDGNGIAREENSGIRSDGGAAREGQGHTPTDSVPSVQTFNPDANDVSTS